jgi:hypothetical protein
VLSDVHERTGREEGEEDREKKKKRKEKEKEKNMKTFLNLKNFRRKIKDNS